MEKAIHRPTLYGNDAQLKSSHEFSKVPPLLEELVQKVNDSLQRDGYKTITRGEEKYLLKWAISELPPEYFGNNPSLMGRLRSFTDTKYLKAQNQHLNQIGTKLFKQKKRHKRVTRIFASKVVSEEDQNQQLQLKLMVEEESVKGDTSLKEIEDELQNIEISVSDTKDQFGEKRKVITDLLSRLDSDQHFGHTEEAVISELTPELLELKCLEMTLSEFNSRITQSLLPKSNEASTQISAFEFKLMNLKLNSGSSTTLIEIGESLRYFKLNHKRVVKSLLNQYQQTQNLIEDISTLVDNSVSCLVGEEFNSDFSSRSSISTNSIFAQSTSPTNSSTNLLPFSTSTPLLPMDDILSSSPPKSAPPPIPTTQSNFSNSSRKPHPPSSSTSASKQISIKPPQRPLPLFSPQPQNTQTPNPPPSLSTPPSLVIPSSSSSSSLPPPPPLQVLNLNNQPLTYYEEPQTQSIDFGTEVPLTPNERPSTSKTLCRKLQEITKYLNSNQLGKEYSEFSDSEIASNALFKLIIDLRNNSSQVEYEFIGEYSDDDDSDEEYDESGKKKKKVFMVLSNKGKIKS